MNLFKEWFKLPKQEAHAHANNLQNQEIAKNQARKQAHDLERKAQEVIGVPKEEYLDVVDPEFQQWLSHTFPKTNDDTLANDYAFKFIVDGYDAIEKSEQYDAEMKQVLQQVLKKTEQQYYEVVAQREKVEALQKKLYRLQHEHLEAQARLKHVPVQVYSSADDFYSNTDIDKTVISPKFQESLREEIGNESVKLYEMNRAYRDAYDRWQALSRQDEATLDRFELNN